MVQVRLQLVLCRQEGSHIALVLLMEYHLVFYIHLLQCLVLQLRLAIFHLFSLLLLFLVNGHIRILDHQCKFLLFCNSLLLVRLFLLLLPSVLLH